MTSSPKYTYEDLFQLIDVDKNNVLSLEEVITFCECLPRAPKAAVVTRLFRQADTDHSGGIDACEFSALCEGLKMLVHMSESDMCEQYITSELRRLFSYLCSNGRLMHKDELRKCLTLLNDMLDARIPTDVIATNARGATSSSDDDTCTFEGFCTAVTGLFPTRSMASIVKAFLEEEAHRKERVSKAKSLFSVVQAVREDEATKKRAANPVQEQLATANARVAALEKELSDVLRDKEQLLTKTVPNLEAELQKQREAVAEKEIGFAKAMRRVTADSDLVQKKLEAAIHKAVELEERWHEEQHAHEAARKRCDETELQVVTLQGELHVRTEKVAAVEELLSAATSKLKTTAEDAEALRARLESAQRRLAEQEKAVTQLQQLQSENQLKEEESVRISRQMNDMKAACDAREKEMEQREQDLDRHSHRLQEREAALDEREKKCTHREEDLAKLEDQKRKEWDEKFESETKRLDSLSRELEVRELEAVQHEADLIVREEVHQSNVQRSEAASFPERTRRLRLLQQIEKDLVARESCLRAADEKYLAALRDPFFATIRSENEELRGKVTRLQSQFDDASQQNTKLQRQLRTTTQMVARSHTLSEAAIESLLNSSLCSGFNKTETSVAEKSI